MRKLNKLALVAAVLASVPAFAEGGFDASGFTTTLTTGVTTAGAVATAIGGLLAGVLVWRKVAKYFNKAG
jgi:hypothetical protein